MSTILDEIVAYKKEFVAHQKSVVPLADLKSRVRDLPSSADFGKAIKRAPDQDIRVIAEVKKASPSKGIIREDFDPVGIAGDYSSNRASAISVLTDEKYFKGHLDYLREIRNAVSNMPLLRKDFTVDEYQIYEAREAGASAILLIAGVLDKFQLRGFRELALELGMNALTEVHLEREADLAAECGAVIIGVNNRDLRTFDVDLKQTQLIMSMFSSDRSGFTFVSESGISRPEDIDYLRTLGVDAILAGETFMRQPSPGAALLSLMGWNSAET